MMHEMLHTCELSTNTKTMNNLDAENIVFRNLKLESKNCAIVPNATMEFKKCFVVFFQSKQYLETGKLNQMLIGDGGVIVDKESGLIFSTGSVYTVERYVEAYEAIGDPYAEKSEIISVFQCTNKTNTTDVTKYLHAKLSIGIAKAKEYVDSVVCGKKIELNCKEPEMAIEISQFLNNHGFLAKQFWKSSNNVIRECSQN